MNIAKEFEHGIIEYTGESLYKCRLTLDHKVSKLRREHNSYGNNWLCKELADAYNLYKSELECVGIKCEAFI